MVASETLRVGRRNMYKSFRVKNFRCFKDLQINDLGRVNLIAGKNNTGKTALMEAMYVHTKPLSPWVLFDLQKTRGLDAPADYMPQHWKQFFYELDTTQRIVIENADSHSPTRRTLTISDHATTNTDPQILEQIRMDLIKYGIAGTDSRVVVGSIDRFLEFKLNFDEGKSDSVFFFRDTWMYRNEEVERKSFFIPAQSRPTKQRVASQFSQLEIDGTLKSLIDVLRILEPRLSDLRLLSPDGELIIWAQMQGIRLPLRVMGEGMNHVCNIAITLLTSPNSVIFIDEIENGIHHTVQCNVWKAIGQVARELDIQVFATTHSLEMIRAAYEAFSEEGKLEEFRYHRLSRSSKTGDIKATTYNELDMEAVAAFGFEHEVR